MKPDEPEHLAEIEVPYDQLEAALDSLAGRWHCVILVVIEHGYKLHLVRHNTSTRNNHKRIPVC